MMYKPNRNISKTRFSAFHVKPKKIFTFTGMFALIFCCCFFHMDPVFLSSDAKAVSCSEEHNQITSSLRLPVEKTCHNKIEAYDTMYFQAVCRGNFYFSVTCKTKETLRIHMKASDGASLSFQKKATGNGFILTPKPDKATIYLIINNHSTSSASVNVLLKKGVNPDTGKKRTPKPVTQHKSKSVSKPETGKKANSTYKKPTSQTKKRKPPAQTAKPSAPIIPKPEKEPAELTGRPHFIRIESNTKIKLSFIIYQNGKKATFLPAEKEFHWISMNPGIAEVRNGILSTKAPGIALVYLQHKTKKHLHSSYLVRVTKSKGESVAIH